MISFATAALVIVFGEIISIPLFGLIERTMPGSRREHLEIGLERLKGLLERAMIVAALLMDFPHILTLYGALKLANRLQIEEKGDEGKNYFLVGNLVSVLLALGYVQAVRWLCPTIKTLLATAPLPISLT